MSILGAKQSLGLAAILLAASNLLSRLMGLIRDKVISWQFGAGSEADLYFAAFVVPDIINYLLAGGFMSITIIPLLARTFQEDENDAWRFFSTVLTWIFLVATFLTVICMFQAEALAGIIAPGFNLEQKTRLTYFMRIVLPAQVFFLTGACFTALLFLRRQFRVPALTPLIYNGSIILGGLLLPAIPLIWEEGSNYQSQLEHFGMTGYCLGVTIGAFIGAFLLPYLTVKRQGLHFKLSFSHPLLKKFIVLALPLMLGQTIIMLDEQFLRIFGSFLDSGTVALLNYGRRVALLPIGLIGQAVAVASYPFLVKLLASGERERFYGTINQAMQAGLSLILPCVAYIFAAAWPILTFIFQGGRFGQPETLACTPLLQILILAVPLWMVYMVLVRAFYAQEDTITPAVTGTIVTLIAVPNYYFVSSRISAKAIALTSAVSVSSYIIWLMLIWRKRFGGAIFKGLGRVSCKALFCALPAALVAWQISALLIKTLELSPWLLSVLVLAVSGIVYLALFFALAAFIWPDFWPFLRKGLLKR